MPRHARLNVVLVPGHVHVDLSELPAEVAVAFRRLRERARLLEEVGEAMLEDHRAGYEAFVLLHRALHGSDPDPAEVRGSLACE